jgi:histidinol-phosphate aminotransferase
MAPPASPSASWPAGLDPYEPVPALAPETVRLAFNESPLGPFPAARAAIAEHAEVAGRYPELDGALIERLRELHGLQPGMVALGNGADAIIGYLSAAYLRPGDEVVTGWPSFPTYLGDAAKQGATVARVPLREGTIDLDAIAAAVGPKTRLVWACTPNNPTGGAVSADALETFLDRVDERVLVVVDEAYIEFCEPGTVADAMPHVRTRGNVASLRTFSKMFGLAGMRVGWLAAPAPVVEAVGRSRHYYDIGALPALAALASLDDPDELRRRRVENARLRELLQDGLARLGYGWLPSEANFVAVEVGDADAVSARLLAGGVATRSLSALGCPDVLRVTVGDERQIARLLELLPVAAEAAAAAS